MKTIPAALAVLLLAGAATAALAQDRGDDRGQGHAAQAAPPPAAHPPTGYQAPQGGHARYGAPPPSGQAPAAQQHFDRAAPAQATQQRYERGPPNPGQQQRYDHAAPNGGGPRYDRAPGYGPGPGAGPAAGVGASRQWDHERGPREVIPPGAERGQSYRPDGRSPDGHSNGFAHDGYHGDPRYNPWGGHGQRWQPGHAPPVFWSHDRYHAAAYRAPYGFYARSWGFGDILPRGWYAQDYWIGDFLDYDLPYPPPGYEWVRVGGDALMIDRYTGRIVQVVRGIFW